MIRSILILLLCVITWSPTQSRANCDKPIKIAVIDTGFGFGGRGKNAKLCKEGHKDFSADQIYTNKFGPIDMVPLDVHGHGTNIAGIIEKYASLTNNNYCIVIIKFYSTKNFESSDPKRDYALANQRASERALEYLSDLKPDIVNYSGGGPGYDPREALAVRRYIDSGGIFVAAAGNEHQDLSHSDINTYYPAMYDSRIIVVGSTDQFGKRAVFSNYGKIVKKWENGINVSGYGLSLSGTSQATAVETGKITGQSNNKCVR